MNIEMEMKMNTLETQLQNKQNSHKHTNTRLSTQTQVLGQTLYRKVEVKNEIRITRSQLYELTRLHIDSFTVKPGWIRQSFTINQRRRRYLNNLLDESGLAGEWCGNCCDIYDWAGSLHLVWHEINGVKPCL